MEFNNLEMQKKINSMKLSEIKSRIEEILNIFRDHPNTVIDELINLNQEVDMLKQVADQRLGDLESYLK